MSMTSLFLLTLDFPLLYGSIPWPTWGTCDVRDRKTGPPASIKLSCADVHLLVLFLFSIHATKSMFRRQGVVKLRWDM